MTRAIVAADRLVSARGAPSNSRDTPTIHHLQHHANRRSEERPHLGASAVIAASIASIMRLVSGSAGISATCLRQSIAAS